MAKLKLRPALGFLLRQGDDRPPAGWKMGLVSSKKSREELEATLTKAKEIASSTPVVVFRLDIGDR